MTIHKALPHLHEVSTHSVAHNQSRTDDAEDHSDKKDDVSFHSLFEHPVEANHDHQYTPFECKEPAPLENFYPPLSLFIGTSCDWLKSTFHKVPSTSVDIEHLAGFFYLDGLPFRGPPTF